VLTKQYDCLGCPVCWPANALNRAADAFPDTTFGEGGACPTDAPNAEPRWPSLPGEYRVLDSAGHIAVCVLTSQPLMERVATARPEGVAIIGTLYTENLGIERVITNVLTNPNITTLIVAGADSQQRIGHLPGQSLLSLIANGLDERSRIIGAQGRRPLLKNISTELVARFRTEIRVVDLIGEVDSVAILKSVEALPTRPRRAVSSVARPAAIRAAAPDRLALDPKGYFVLFPDRVRGLVVAEHYENSGSLAHIFEGAQSDHLYATILAHDLVSRLDHAAYLGQELARAARALATGEPYVQDRAPERCGPGCGCHSARTAASEGPA